MEKLKTLPMFYTFFPPDISEFTSKGYDSVFLINKTPSEFTKKEPQECICVAFNSFWQAGGTVRNQYRTQYSWDMLGFFIERTLWQWQCSEYRKKIKECNANCDAGKFKTYEDYIEEFQKIFQKDISSDFLYNKNKTELKETFFEKINDVGSLDQLDAGTFFIHDTRPTEIFIGRACNRVVTVSILEPLVGPVFLVRKENSNDFLKMIKEDLYRPTKKAFEFYKRNQEEVSAKSAVYKEEEKKQ